MIVREKLIKNYCALSAVFLEVNLNVSHWNFSLLRFGQTVMRFNTKTRFRECADISRGKSEKCALGTTSHTCTLQMSETCD